MRKLSLLILPLAWTLLGCPTTDEIDHMEHQPKGKPYRTSDFFANGQLMQRPPFDTVPLEHDEGNPIGAVPDGGITPTSETIPYKIDADFMNLGKAKFNIVCAVCHGYGADGNSIVARKMSLRSPPNITTEVYRNRPDGYFFSVITNGYGYMNPYRDQLSSRERWAVVAYLRALQLSQSAPKSMLAAQDLQQLEHPQTGAGNSENGNE